jgi:sugar lactone lactonase YvrE
VGNVSSCVIAVIVSVCAASSTYAQQLTRVPGSIPVGKTATPQDVSVTLSASGTVSRIRVLTQGSEGADFTSVGDTCTGISYVAGQTCTVQVGFKPVAPGERRGAIVLLDNHNHPLAAQPLAGQASGALATFIPGEITTVAGTTTSFLYSGDGAAATNASLFLPSGVALDGAGNIYIADTYNNRIREVDAQTGIITTIAGNGSITYGGDGNSALAVGLDNPSSVAIDSAGNIYVTDTYNNAIRVINAETGIITTVAGNGTAAYSGDNGQARSASLNTPHGITLDASNNLYIADSGNNVVRRVSSITGIISTIAGTGVGAYSGDGEQATAAALNTPWGVAISDTGNLYIADQQNNAVRMVDTAGVITTIAGGLNPGTAGDGGPAAASRLSSPSGVLIDAAGNVYISDTTNNRIQKINPATSIVTTIAGSGSYPDNNPANTASLYGPYGIALDGQGSLYIADAAHNRIRKVASNVAILNYPLMHVGSVSSPMTQVLENDGTTSLAVSSVTAVSNAVVDPSTTCNSTTVLAPLAQCSIAADFAPATTNVTGSIMIDSDALNASSLLRLQGGVESTYPATVLLSSSPNPSISGNQVLFSVQVINQAGIVVTGTVTLLDGPNTIATLTLMNGNASVFISNLPVGQHSITASYGGDINDAAAVSSPLLQVVTVAPANASTTTLLTSSANPSNLGQTINLNASVSTVTVGQAVPTGTISFLDGSSTLGTANLNAGTASLALSTLALGTHSLTVVYSGSSSYTGSTSPVLPQVVVAPNAVTTTSLTASADPIGVGSNLTLYTTVVAASMGQAVPTGSVSIMDGTNNLGTVSLSSGTASVNTSSLSVGTHFLTAVYSGSTTYNASTSPVLTEIVVATSIGNTPQFTMTVTPSSLTLQSGSHATLQVVITTLSTFADTLSLGCGALPKGATCTFSQDHLAVSAGSSTTVSVILDTGNPLGSGASSKLSRPWRGDAGGVLACFLPFGAMLSLCLKRRQSSTKIITLGIGVVAICAMFTLSGCGSLSTTATAPGTYSINVFANGASTGASYTVPVQLTVSK